MAEQGQGVALDPPGAKPLDLKYIKINGFPKAVGLWWVQGKALALAFSIGQSLEKWVLFVMKLYRNNIVIVHRRAKLAEFSPGACGGDDVARQAQFRVGERGATGAWRARGARWPGAGRQAQPLRQGHAEGAAERAEQAAGLWGGFDEGAHVGVVQCGFELARGRGGFGNALVQPANLARQARVLRRGGGRGAGGAGQRPGRQGVGAPAIEQTLKTGGQPAEAVPDQAPDFVVQLRQAGGWDEGDKSLAAEPNGRLDARLPGHEHADGGAELGDEPGEARGDCLH